MGEIADAIRRAREEREREPLPPAAERAPAARPAAAPAPRRPPERPAADAPRPAPPPVRRGEGEFRARAAVVDANGPIGVSFRRFALRVRRELEERGARSLFVTSALPNEGKSLTACNLAQALAALGAGKRIALAEFDLRQPTFHRVLGIEPSLGFEQVIAGTARLDEACIASDVPGLDLYIAKRTPHGVREPLAGAGLETVVRDLTRRYDTVVIDTPPALAVPDLHLLAPLADAGIAVVRAGVTRVSALREMLDNLPPGKLIGVFLNEARETRNLRASYRYYAEEAEAEADA